MKSLSPLFKSSPPSSALYSGLGKSGLRSCDTAKHRQRVVQKLALRKPDRKYAFRGSAQPNIHGQPTGYIGSLLNWPSKYIKHKMHFRRDWPYLSIQPSLTQVLHVQPWAAPSNYKASFLNHPARVQSHNDNFLILDSGYQSKNKCPNPSYSPNRSARWFQHGFFVGTSFLSITILI